MNIHPFELAISGYSGSGKTTLITRIIQSLSTQLSIAFVKHDAHRFDMDKEGKDTWRAREAGAKYTFINSSGRTAMLTESPIDPFLLAYDVLDADILLMEGFKKTSLRKILVLGEGEQKVKALDNWLVKDDIDHVLAVVGRGPKDRDYRVPYFRSDDITAIVDFILAEYKKIIRKTSLKGLILVGGKSSRMGRDKANLHYHGIPQYQYLDQILKSHCDEVLISCRQEQTFSGEQKQIPIVEDLYLGMGPMGGILSAFAKHPNSAFLVVACDLPFLSEKTLEKLIECRNPFKVSTCYRNPKTQYLEPLCTIYEPKAKVKLHQFMGLGKICPRKVLMNSSCEILELKDENALDNINTYEEHVQAIEALKGISL